MNVCWKKLLACSILILLFILSCGRRTSSSTSSGGATTPTPTVSATITPTNFASGSTLYSGVLIGTVTSTAEIGTIRVTFDSSIVKDATGTQSWSVKVPNMADNSVNWRIGSSHTVNIKVLGANSAELGESNYTVKRGMNMDFDGDGYSDVIVGAGSSSISGSGRGIAYIYSGSSSGVSTSVARTLTYPGSDNGANFGYSVAKTGDVNGDGYGDVLVGAYLSAISGTNRGIAYLYLGSSSGVSNSPYRTFTYPGSDNNAYFGISVSAAGDVNADGYADLLVGSPGSNSSKGVVYVYHGSSVGPSTTPNGTLSYSGSDSGAFFGYPVSWAGDVNNDGYADIIVGSFQSDISAADKGAAFVYHGSSGSLSTSPSTTLAYPGSDASPLFGYSVAGAGDINNDGYSDVVVGAPGSDMDGTDQGAVFVHRGSVTGVSGTAVQSLFYPATDSANFGKFIVGGFDVNKDGYADVAVTAYLSGIVGPTRGAVFVYHGSAGTYASSADQILLYPGSDDAAAFGGSIGFAGDVNGDTYGDIIVGSQAANGTGTDLGISYVFHGGIPTIGTTAATILNYPGSDNGANFGTGVSKSDYRDKFLCSLVSGKMPTAKSRTNNPAIGRWLSRFVFSSLSFSTFKIY
ncbi:MAG: FG-GAP repeat protein [Deltaproteobacteria bacterium]|nr:FG-GAP repeat protein [Deltaproteobacteria bacterium]